MVSQLPTSCAQVTLFFFFFNDTATTEIYTLSLHDALPIYLASFIRPPAEWPRDPLAPSGDRKSTRLNSSHRCISYAVFCLKKTIHPTYNLSLLAGPLDRIRLPISDHAL